jgi:hypothetical protein
MERFSTRDHHKRGTVVFSVQSVLSQRLHGNGGMLINGPGVFGVTPRTTHIAAGKADEKSTASRMVTFSL